MKQAVTILFCLISATAFAQPRPGTYTGVRECKGAAGSIAVDATSKKTIGVATCKTELGKKLVADGACTGKKKGAWVAYSFRFGKDGEPNQATGTGKLFCP